MTSNQTFTRATLFVPDCSDSLSDIAKSLVREYDKKNAAEAGYDDVGRYRLDLIMKNPKYPARNYLECTHEYGVESPKCKMFKERWLELKAAQNGTAVDWNGEEVHKMLKEDAIKAGYKEGHFYKKDPGIFQAITRQYKKCLAEHGAEAENTFCKDHKKVWLEAKSFQNA